MYAPCGVERRASKRLIWTRFGGGLKDQIGLVRSGVGGFFSPSSTDSVGSGFWVFWPGFGIGEAGNSGEHGRKE